MNVLGKNTLHVLHCFSKLLKQIPSMLFLNTEKEFFKKRFQMRLSYSFELGSFVRFLVMLSFHSLVTEQSLMLTARPCPVGSGSMDLRLEHIGTTPSTCISSWVCHKQDGSRTLRGTTALGARSLIIYTVANLANFKTIYLKSKAEYQ